MWIVGHLVALIAVIAFVFLGRWQLSRHADRSALDAQVEARTTQQPISFPDAVLLPADEVELQPVRVIGTYDPDREVVLQARSYNGRSGHNVVTPLVTNHGVVLINRGWIPIDVAGPPVTEAPAPSGEITVVGFARGTEVHKGFGPKDPPTGILERINRVDIDRLRAQFPYDIASFYLQQLQPETTGLPLVLPAPVAGQGPPHLPYAVQWFVFAAVVAAGYPTVLRSNSRNSAST